MIMKRLSTIMAVSMVALGAATSAYAIVSCPSTNEVKKSVDALNTVMRQSEKGFFVLTAQPAISSSNLDWMIAAQVSANGFDAAFASGQKSVRSVMSSVTEEPMEQQGYYICAYMTTSGMNVMAVAPQQQKMTFNPGTINMDAFTPNKH